jgi:large subunit ribosomal protein L18
MKLSKIQRKKYRVRNKIKKFSSRERYRLSVNRSTKNISVQIIDDEKKVTLVSASSNTKEIKSQKKSKKELSKIVAEQLAQKAKNIKITKVYFDRGIYKYHGRVKLLADELRKNGMEF